MSQLFCTRKESRLAFSKVAIGSRTVVWASFTLLQGVPQEKFFHVLYKKTDTNHCGGACLLVTLLFGIAN